MTTRIPANTWPLRAQAKPATRKVPVRGTRARRAFANRGGARRHGLAIRLTKRTVRVALFVKW